MVRTRLIFLNTVLIGGVLAAFGFAVYLLSGQNLRNAIDKELERRGKAIALAAKNITEERIDAFRGLGRLSEPVIPNQSPNVRRILFSEAFLLPRFYGPGNFPLFQSPPPWDLAAVNGAWKGAEGLSLAKTAEGSFRIRTVPLDRGEGPVAVVQLAASLADADEEQARLARVLLTLVPVALIATALAGFLLTRFALKPVRSLSKSAGRIEAANLSERLPVRGRDEFAELSGSFNSVLDRLERAFDDLAKANETLRRFTADASHELKTPLTAIRLRAEVAALSERRPEEYRRAMAEIVELTLTMSTLINDMLLLAKSDERQLPIGDDWIDAEQLVDEAVSKVGPDAASQIDIEVQEGMSFRGDSVLLCRVLVNLLSNAKRHTSPPGRIRVSALTASDAIQIVVSDDGEGIPQEHLHRVFDRFYRVDSAREREAGGSGLGLAICKTIVESHGGSISIASQGGVLVTISLPVGAKA